MTDELPESVQHLIDAVNNGDSDAFVDTFTSDGIVDDWGREFHGHDAVRDWSDDELIGKNATLAVTDAEMEGTETIVVVADVGGDGFNGPTTFTFAIHDDRIARMTIGE